MLLFGVSGASGMESKLLEMGIPFCYIGEYLEESPLGKAEWLVAIAEITDSREKGEAVFEPVPERYDALRAKVAAATSKHPKVMINTPYAGSWFMASTESYVARLIADAGGDYILQEEHIEPFAPTSTSKRRICSRHRPICGSMRAVPRHSGS